MNKTYINNLIEIKDFCQSVLTEATKDTRLAGWNCEVTKIELIPLDTLENVDEKILVFISAIFNYPDNADCDVTYSLRIDLGKSFDYNVGRVSGMIELNCITNRK